MSVPNQLAHRQLLDLEQAYLFTPLRGGMTNQAFLLEQAGVKRTVKVYDLRHDTDNPMYPNLPEVEALTLTKLSGLKLAPSLLGQWQTRDEQRSTTTAVLVYEYIEGHAWRSGTAAVARLLSALHDTDVLGASTWLRKLPCSAQAVCEHGDRMLQAHALSKYTQSDVLAKPMTLEQLQALRPSQPNTQLISDLSFVHGDCWGGNIIQNEKALTLIDWQCPGLGDAAEDIANFLSPGMMSFCRETPLSETEKQAFFDAYEDQTVIKRYKRDAASWHWRLACYYYYRQQVLSQSNPALADGYALALAHEVSLLQTL
ncbi:aminoglycoside phosphotransferase family protein [Leucothrix sargassi]|nr:aminoglycoside phosphotransferase family protein [Leucothrix sargassi]